MKTGTLSIVLLPLCLIISTASCIKDDESYAEITAAHENVPDTATAVNYKPEDNPIQPASTPEPTPTPAPVDLDGNITVTPYAELSFLHQSSAVYGDYLFIVKEGHQSMLLFDMARKQKIYTLRKTTVDKKVYHCNQSSFGVQRYDSEDYFPLLYVSQRPRSENRCVTEVFRIIPLFNADSTALVAFRTELVQEIFFPPMSSENSLGNVNCVIDAESGWMYTYSRNNNGEDSNYMQCKISRFAIPDVHEREVYLEDSDILSSFMIDARASNMQGGCIAGGRLYIGQGYPYAKYVYLNVVDLKEEKLVKRYDLLARGVDWEPEGCIYYDGSVMLTYTTGISRIIEEDEDEASE